MIGTQVVINNMTPEDVSTLLTRIVETTVRAEIQRFAKETEAASSLPEYVSIKQVCKLLGVTRYALLSWAKDTEDRSAILVPFKVGGSVRYRRDDVLNLLRESRRFESK